MIIVRVWEGLGNQMFQYAYARLLKEKSGKKVFLEGRRIYRECLPQEDLSVERKCTIYHYKLSLKFVKPELLNGWSYLGRRSPFQILKYWLSKQGVGKNLLETDENDMFAYHERLMSVHDHTYVIGHFFNRKYIEPIRDILLKEFSLKKEPILPEDLKTLMKSEETVSVHLRRGDYLYVECAQVINREMRRGRYYERAQDYISERVKNPVFLFFSDDIEWVKENIPCKYRHYYVSDIGLQDYEELIVMSRCRHNIIANSTFSFWAGWLNQNEKRIVVAPKHWMPTIIPKDWVQM